jgi:hypothetical protein
LCASTNCTSFPLEHFEVFSEILKNVPKVLGWHWRSKGIARV